LFLERLKSVVHLFAAMNIEVHQTPQRSSGPAGTATKSKQKYIRLIGCSSILGFPLPNNGLFLGMIKLFLQHVHVAFSFNLKVLFKYCVHNADVPVDVINTAVGHIAHLVDAISAVMNISLPHPLFPLDLEFDGKCMISAQSDWRLTAFSSTRKYSLESATFLSSANTPTTLNAPSVAPPRQFDWTTLGEVLAATYTATAHASNAPNAPTPNAAGTSDKGVSREGLPPAYYSSASSGGNAAKAEQDTFERLKIQAKIQETFNLPTAASAKLAVEKLIEKTFESAGFGVSGHPRFASASPLTTDVSVDYCHMTESTLGSANRDSPSTILPSSLSRSSLSVSESASASVSASASSATSSLAYSASSSASSIPTSASASASASASKLTSTTSNTPSSNPVPAQSPSPAKSYIANPLFATALTLLQADCISLCVQMGMNPDKLWPPEAMLLNLSELHRGCVLLVGQLALSVEETPDDFPLLFNTAPYVVQSGVGNRFCSDVPPCCAVSPAISSTTGSDPERGTSTPYESVDSVDPRDYCKFSMVKDPELLRQAVLSDSALASLHSRYGTDDTYRRSSYSGDHAAESDFDNDSEWDIIDV
jgi:hypothetical protein